MTPNASRTWSDFPSDGRSCSACSEGIEPPSVFEKIDPSQQTGLIYLSIARIASF